MTCDVVRLELLHHEDTPVGFRTRSTDLAQLQSVPIDKRTCARALEVQARLAGRRGAKHRAVRLPDYLIAAAAELANLPLLHYDADYELVATITRQPQEWIAPRGSL